MGNPKKGLTKFKEAMELVDREKGLTFNPSKGQRMLKAKFWNYVNTSFGLTKAPEDMSAQEIAVICESAGIKQYWSEPGFADWFLNRNEAQHKLEYLFSLALDSAEQILLDTDPKSAAARVQMIRVISELARKMPSAQEQRFADERINKMSAEELAGFLEQHGVQVRQEQIIELQKEAEDDNGK